MKTNVGRMLRVMVWLAVAGLSLVAPSSLSAQEAKLRTTLKGHTNTATSIAYSPDGKALASGSRDTMIRLWDVPTALKADK
jgi:WD40 repeat protein